MQSCKIAGLASVVFSLGACTVGPTYQVPSPAVPAQFQASLPPFLPHDGRLGNLKNWWAQFDDPLVVELVDAAQAGSPTLAQALARIAQARAGLVSSRSTLFPALDGNVRTTRAKALTGPGVDGRSSSAGANLDASWEIDLFGANRHAAAAADARLAARTAGWHEMRISLAAEVAAMLVGYRACRATAAVLAQDLGSREQTGQLTALKVKAGFTAPADGALIEASMADARQRLIAQRAECDLNIKALVALSGLAEPDLRAKLAGNDNLPRPAGIAVDMVPAQALAQRPDIAAQERELAAAAADIDVAQARRLPRLSLLGSIGIAGLRVAGTPDVDGGTWSFGPALSLPLFDAGRGKAGVDAAQARYDEQLAAYRQLVRSAVREIEEALVRLDAAARRETDASAAARDFERFLLASDDRFKAGTGSLLDLEEARRTALAARQTLISLQRERVLAWISLYKALGGGWRADLPPPNY